MTHSSFFPLMYPALSGKNYNTRHNELERSDFGLIKSKLNCWIDSFFKSASKFIFRYPENLTCFLCCQQFFRLLSVCAVISPFILFWKNVYQPCQLIINEFKCQFDSLQAFAGFVILSPKRAILSIKQWSSPSPRAYFGLILKVQNCQERQFLMIIGAFSFE